jgi:hypothetical protein
VTIRLQQALFEESTKLPSFAFQGVTFPGAAAATEEEDDDDELEVDVDEDH